MKSLRQAKTWFKMAQNVIKMKTISSLIWFGCALIAPLASAADINAIYQAMTADNQAALLNAPSDTSWSKRGVVTQGIPKGEAAPDYWTQAIKASGKNIQYTQGAWRAMTTWFALYPGAQNKAAQANINVSDLNAWVLVADTQFPQDVRKAKWQHVINEAAPLWAGDYQFDLINYIQDRPNQDSNTQAQYQMSNTPIHGGSDTYCIQGMKTDANQCLQDADILGVFVKVKAWLEDPQPHTQVLMSVGADYYPDANVRSQDLVGVNYLPGAGGSRFELLTTSPTWFYMANLSSPTQKDAQGNFLYEANNQWTRQGGKTYLTLDELKQNPPPM